MANRIKSGALTANTVGQVVFATWSQSIEIVNRGSTEIWARVDKVDPTVAGDDCFFVAPQGFLEVSNPQPAPTALDTVTRNCDIRMISTGTPAYTVSAGV